MDHRPGRCRRCRWSRTDGPVPIDPQSTSADPASAPPGRARLGRRAFLGLAAAPGLSWRSMRRSVGPAGPRLFGDARRGAAPWVTSGGSKLVLVTLYGGNDGLNTVVPFEDPAYAARGSLALDAVHRPSARRRVRAPPRHAGLQEALGRAASSPSSTASASPTRTTATSSRWTSGRPACPPTPVATGWIGRWLDATRSSPLRAITVGPTVPTVLTGERVQGAAVPTGPLASARGSRWSRRSTRRFGRGLSSGPSLDAESAASDAVLLELDRRIGPILVARGHDEPAPPFRQRQIPPSEAAQLAIANGGGGQASRGRPGRAAQRRRQPDPGRCGGGRLQRRARWVRHPRRPGAAPEHPPVRARHVRHRVRRRAARAPSGERRPSSWSTPSSGDVSGRTPAAGPTTDGPTWPSWRGRRSRAASTASRRA